MSKKLGWVSAHRSMLLDDQYKDADTLALWIHLLLRASYEDKTIKHGGQTIHIKRGQFVTGRKSLSEASGVQESKIQRILKRWQNEQQIEQQAFSKYRVISIVNYDKYQGSEQQSDADLNTINNSNKSNKKQSSFKKPSVGDVANYFISFMPVALAKSEAQAFVEYYESVNWVVGKSKKPMAKWKSAASGWNKRRVEREKNTRHSGKSAATRTAENISKEFGQGISG